MEQEIQTERIAELMAIEEITPDMLRIMGYTDKEGEIILQDYNEKYAHFERSLLF